MKTPMLPIFQRLLFSFRSAANIGTAIYLFRSTILFSLALRWPTLQARLGREDAYACQLKQLDNELYLRPLDVPIFYEIFQDGGYTLPQELKVPTQALVFDIGAHVGLFSRWFRQSYGAQSRVVVVEASPASAVVLRKNLPKSKNNEFLLRAISTKPGRVFFATGNLSYNNRISEQETALEVPAITLDELFDTYASEQAVFMLKMDIEGQEAKVLPQLRAHTNRLHYLLIELHPPYGVADLVRDLQIESSQVQTLQETTYLVNFAHHEQSSLSAS